MAAEYKKGSPPIGGIDYEIKLQTLFALAGFQHFQLKQWKLSNENEAAGKFDDLVFEIESENILLQSKHKAKDKLQENQFLSSNPKNDDFSLPKYILSFKTLKGFNIKYMIICTNSDMKIPLLKQKTLEDYDLIHKIFENCQVYTISDDYFKKIEEKISEYQNNLKSDNKWKNLQVERREIEDFFSKCLCVRAKDGHIENAIRNKLTMIQKRTKYQVSSYKYVLDQLQEWYKTKSNKASYMTNQYIKSILYGEENKRYIESLLDEKNIYKDHYYLTSSGLYNIIFEKRPILYLKKILQGLWMSYKKDGKPKDMFFNEVLLLNTNSVMYEEILDCFNVSKLKFLVILITNGSQKFSHTVKTFEEIVTKKKIDKKIIILSSRVYFNDKTTFKTINDKILFNNFELETQNQFLEKEISFQGASFCLKQINTVNIDFDKLIDECIIEKFINSEKFSIGLKLKELSEINNYYICRKLQKVNESFTEDEILDKCREPVLVISDQPGTGKSTLIVKLANNWKRLYPDHWIILLDLGITNKYLKENKEYCNLLDLLLLHERSKSNFDKELIQLLKKIIILDGVDEISSSERTDLFNFVSTISEREDIIKIVITTRSYSFILEEIKVVDNIDFISLEEFSSQNQIEFFKKYFKYTSNIEVQNAKEFVETCPILFKSFLNIPLYIEMIADIFSDEIIKINKHMTMKITNTYELFKLFMNKRKNIFITNKCSCKNNSVLFNILSDSFDRYLEDIQILATRANFENTPELNFIVDRNKKIRNTVLHAGVLEVTEKNKRFVHKTFEEYFVAQHIWNKITDRNTNKNILKQIYRQVFLNIEKQNVCHFIDCLLETEPNTLKHLSKLFSDIVNEIDYTEDKGIYSLASQGSVHLMKMLFDNCSNFSLIINRKGSNGETALLLSAHHLPTVDYLVSKGADLYLKDKKGYTALHYAVTRFSSFENFELQLSSFTKSLLYKDMMYHINSVQNNLYNYNERRHFKKRLNGYQRNLILQHQANDFSDIVNYFKNKNLFLNTQTTIGSTILHYIAYCGLIKEFNCLITSGASIENKDFYGNNIMHYAVLGGSLEIVRYLYNLGVVLDNKNFNGVAPIHFTPIGNSLEVLKFLLHNGVDIETTDSCGRTALFYVNASTSLDLVKFILNLDNNIDRRSTELYYTALHMASYTNAIDIVKYFITECKLMPSPDKVGQYPEFYAAEGNAVKVLKYYQNAIHPIETIVDIVGASVLHLAAVGDAINAVIYLVEQVGMSPIIQDSSERTPLHYAAGSGSLECLKYFVKKGFSTNLLDDFGSTIIHYATKSKSLKLLKYIIEETDATIEVTDNSGKHAIHKAAENGFLEGVKYFLERDVPASITDKIGNTILHYSALGNSLDTTKYIFKSYPQLYQANKVGKYPIHCSVEGDSLDILKYFNQNFNDVPTILKNGVTLLHLASRSNSIKVVEYLTTECCFKMTEDQDGRFPFHYAAENDALDVVKYFLEKGINKDFKDRAGRTLVHCAALSNSVKTLMYCVSILKMDHKTCDYNGKIPLHYAAIANNLKAIKYILSLGNVDISIPDYRKITVLHWCAYGNSVEAFKYFFKDCHSTDIHSKDVIGRQPIHVAVQSDALEIVQFIFSYESDSNKIVDKNGNTLLHWAAKYDSIRVIKYFVEKCGMSVELKNRFHVTPLQTAILYRSSKAMKYFGIVPEKKCVIS